MKGSREKEQSHGIFLKLGYTMLFIVCQWEYFPGKREIDMEDRIKTSERVELKPNSSVNVAAEHSNQLVNLVVERWVLFFCLCFPSR